MPQPSEWNIPVCENESCSSELEQALIDAVQAPEIRHREDFRAISITNGICASCISLLIY